MSVIDETWEHMSALHIVTVGDGEEIAFEDGSAKEVDRLARGAMAAAAPDLARAIREMCLAFLTDDIPRRAAAYMQAEAALEKAGVNMSAPKV